MVAHLRLIIEGDHGAIPEILRRCWFVIAGTVAVLATTARFQKS